LLPEGVDKDGFRRVIANGMLEITAPMSAAALPKENRRSGQYP